jgi:hypothetical protein
MKTSLLIGAFSVALLIAGCNTNTPPASGPAGPQGQVGQTGQQGDTGQSGQQGTTGQTGDRGRMGQTGDMGQTGQTGDTGQAGRTGDQGVQGQAAPCPAGQHRYTNPDTGRTSCVRD